MSSKTVYGSFAYITLVSFLVVSLLVILSLLVGSDLFMMVLTLTVGVSVILAVFGLLSYIKRKISQQD